MRNRRAGAIFSFTLLLLFSLAAVPARTDKPTAPSKGSGASAQTCDSLKNPVPGESLADAARRNRAWKACVAEQGSEADDKKPKPPDANAAPSPRGRAGDTVTKDKWPESVNAPTPSNQSIPGQQEQSWSERYQKMLELQWQSRQSFQVYRGTLETAVKPLQSEIDGLAYRLIVRIVNTSSEAYSVRYTVKCGAWTKNDRAYIGPDMTLDDSAPYKPDEQFMVYVPKPPCKAGEVGLDVVRKDVDLYQCNVRDYANQPVWPYVLKGQQAWERSAGWGVCR